MEKSANIFRFKRFNVVNERSAMKVNTDGVLLGALMTILPQDRSLLDIGTGTGTIALMAAQRLRSFADAQDDKGRVQAIDTVPSSGHCSLDRQSPAIDAIDIDEPSATEAAANFRNSPWDDVLQACHASLDDFASCCPQAYDLIFSNPPYFDDALQAPEERRNAARHTAKGLSYREILEFAAERLTPEGRVSLILPADTERDLTRHARMCGLHMHRIIRVRTVPRKTPSRIVAEFVRKHTATPEDKVLTIQDGGKYTEEYLELMRDFYLFA